MCEKELAAALAREAKLREELAFIAQAAESWHGPEGLGTGHERALKVIATGARAALASPEASGACPRCHGEGVVTFNKSRDPQQADDGVCDVCHGTGDAPAEPATEEKP
jgi:hypothetical protein